MGAVKLKKHNMTFIHIPKTGGQSIREYLMSVPGAEIMPLNKREINVKHPDIWTAQKHFGELGWSFCVVRNPYDRIVSMWGHLQRVGYTKSPFRKFVMKEAKYDDYMKPMSAWFDHIDHVIKFENLRKDFQLVQDKIGVKSKLIHKNKSAHKPYTEYYDDELIEFVSEKFKEDLQRFDYKYPYE